MTFSIGYVLKLICLWPQLHPAKARGGADWKTPRMRGEDLGPEQFNFESYMVGIPLTNYVGKYVRKNMVFD